MDNIGGRKFALALLSGVSALVLVWIAKIPPAPDSASRVLGVPD
ncbi:MAG TPA: hypothetical protein VLJ86_17390 [Ramlibacter sp.]|nr:hypothetical protein [Ramlibacter sp.]